MTQRAWMRERRRQARWNALRRRFWMLDWAFSRDTFSDTFDHDATLEQAKRLAARDPAEIEALYAPRRERMAVDPEYAAQTHALVALAVDMAASVTRSAEIAKELAPLYDKIASPEGREAMARAYAEAAP